MPNLPFRSNKKGRGFFIVKGTAALIIDTSFLEFDVTADDIDNIKPILYFRNIISHQSKE